MTGSVHINVCPQCGAQVAQHNLRDHQAKVHPRAGDRFQQFAARRWKTWLFVATAVVGILAVSYFIASAPESDKAAIQGEWVGRPAPDFALADARGGTYALADQRGEWVLLFLNEGLGCAPCVRQVQDMEADNDRFAALGVTQAAMSVNALPRLQDWVHRANIQQVAVLSDPDLAVEREYDAIDRDVSMMPGMTAGHTYILVDPDGIIRWRADYGPGVMYVDQDEIYDAVKGIVEA